MRLSTLITIVYIIHAYAMYDIIIKGSVNSKLEQPTVSLKGPGEMPSTNIIMLLFKTECFLFTYTCARLAWRYVIKNSEFSKNLNFQKLDFQEFYIFKWPKFKKLEFQITKVQKLKKFKISIFSKF